MLAEAKFVRQVGEVRERFNLSEEEVRFILEIGSMLLSNHPDKGVRGAAPAAIVVALSMIRDVAVKDVAKALHVTEATVRRNIRKIMKYNLIRVYC